MLLLCAIGDMCRLRFISLNFADLLSLVAVISTQFSMMSPGENEVLYAITFNMMIGHFVEFVQILCSQTGHFMASLGQIRSSMYLMPQSHCAESTAE